MTISLKDFTVRVCVGAGIVAVAVVLLAALWQGTQVLLLLFAAVLLAAMFHGLAGLLRKWSGLSQGWALCIVVVALFSAVGLAIWLLAPSVASQVEQMSSTLAGSVQQVEAQLQRSSWGRFLLEKASNAGNSRSLNLFSRVTGVFSTTLGVLTNTVLVIIIGIYLAVKPAFYVTLLVRLIPIPKRLRVQAVFNETGMTLRRWLAGRAILMVVNGALTALGLWLLGVPLALTLGIIAGLLNFIPNIGPIIAGIPAVLIAWTQGPTQALSVLALYVVLQSIDGYLFTPLVQQRTVSMPPALTIFAQFLFGVMAGPPGILLATPIVAVLGVFVKRLYLEDALGETHEEPSHKPSA